MYKASDILTSELFKSKPRETMIATDIESDERVVNASAGAESPCGIKPMVYD